MFEQIISLVAFTGVVAVIALGLTVFHYYKNFRTCCNDTAELFSMVATSDSGLADWDT